MAAGQSFRFAAVTTVPERAHCMDDVPRAELPSGGGYSLSCGKMADARNNLLASFQNLRTSSTMDCAVHASSAEQRRVGSIHNGISLLPRDVSWASYHEKAVTQGKPQNFRRAEHAA